MLFEKIARKVAEILMVEINGRLRDEVLAKVQDIMPPPFMDITLDTYDCEYKIKYKIDSKTGERVGTVYLLRKDGWAL